ncbi:MAG: (Fe-S)-binding protein [Candidatus Thorarchaeota archaeon]
MPEIDIADIVETRRRQLVEEGRFPSGLNPMVDSIRTHHNPYNEPHEKRTSWLKIPKVDGRSLVYFTGCTAAYRENSIARDAVSVLSSLGYQVDIPKDEWCCGSPLLRTGFVEDALEQARHNVEILNSMDAEEIVVTCPGCYRVLTQDYPNHGLELNKPVRHIAELLRSHLKSLPEFELDGPVTFHDSCHLGRHSGVYEQPRKIIERVTKGALVEMERNRDNAMCCGNGAGLRTLFPEHAKKIGAERVQQAERTGAKYLITSCPFCKNMLESQAKDRLIVLDLPELIEMAKKRAHVKTD